MKIEERAKAIVDYAWSRRTTEDPPLIDVALEHLRAVEREALERAAKIAERILDDNPLPYLTIHGSIAVQIRAIIAEAANG